MPVTNRQIVHEAIAGYKTAIFDEVENRCRKFCTDLCQEAINARKNAPGAHNFTGNLINSIVVCLYRNREPINAYYAAQHVPKAIQVKMRQRTRKHYRFNPDYDGDKSHYLPTVQTNGGWGEDDARHFFQDYVPKGKNLFDIVVAYPVEYGNWVETQRSTTGILQTYAHAEAVGVTYLKLIRK
jgi:hypothetical protein